jgi:hypothetical protein
MINAIGEATMQQFVRSNYVSGTYDKDLEGQKTEKIIKQRPVEESEKGHRPELDMKSEEDLKSRNILEEGKLLVEKYDGNGRLIRVTPPGYLPPGAKV